MIFILLGNKKQVMDVSVYLKKTPHHVVIGGHTYDHIRY